METIFTQANYPVTVLQPVADRYNLNPSTGRVNMALVDHVCFLLSEGAGGVGTAKLTVEARKEDDSDPVLVKFWVRATPAASRVLGDLIQVDVPATGYTTIAGANKTVAIEVQGIGVPEDHPLVDVLVTEVVNAPVDAGIIAIAHRERYSGLSSPTP